MTGLIESMRSATTVALRILVGAALALLLVVGIGPHFFSYRPVTVLTGSMRPQFSPGDMVLLTPKPVQHVVVGDVISYRIPVGAHQVETHRVIRILEREPKLVVITKGDANNGPDPWTAVLEDNHVWRVRAVLPKVGLVVHTFRSPLLKKLTVYGAPGLLLLLWLVDIWSQPGRARTRAEPAG